MAGNLCSAASLVISLRWMTANVLAVTISPPFGERANGRANRKRATSRSSLLSAHALDGEREKAFAAGCDEFDAKPIQFERLLATLRRLGERRQGLGRTICGLRPLGFDCKNSERANVVRFTPESGHSIDAPARLLGVQAQARHPLPGTRADRVALRFLRR